jgi:serine/threonine protein kinase
MRRYRIKFSPGARAVVEGHYAARNSEQSALRDLTDGGTKLRYERLPRNERGPCIEIFGTGLRAMAGPEARRLDTLFVFRIMREERPSPATALVMEAAFELLPYEHAAEMDAVSEIIVGAPAPSSSPGVGGSILRSTAPSRPKLPSAEPRPKPETQRSLALSDTARSALARGGAHLRDVFHPLKVDELSLEPLRKTWKQLVEGTRRKPGASTREDLILSGITEPRELGADGLRALRAYLEAVFFFEVLEPKVGSPDDMVGLAAEYARSAIASDVARALLWSATVSELPGSELRSSILELSNTCAHLTPDREPPWWDAINREVCSRQVDLNAPRDAAAVNDLMALITEVDNSTASIAAALVAAARERSANDGGAVVSALEQTGEIESARSLYVAPPAEAALASPSPDLTWQGHRRAVDAWALREDGRSLGELEALRGELEGLAEAVSAMRSALETVDGLGSIPKLGHALHDFVDRYSIHLSEERGTRWQRALEHARSAFDAACARVGKIGPVLRAISSDGVTPAELVAGSEMFVGAQSWRHLPEWWWRQSGDPEDAAAPTNVADDGVFLERLCNAALRNLTGTAMARLEALDEELRPAVRNIRPPPRGTGADEHLFSELTKLSRTLGHARQKYATTIGGLLTNGVLEQEDFVEAAEQLDRIEPSLSASTFGALCTYCASSDDPKSLRRTLRAAHGALKEIVSFWGGASLEDAKSITTDVSWNQLLAKMGQFGGRDEPQVDASTDPPFTLDYANVKAEVFDEETRQQVVIPDRPPLFFVAAPAEPFGHVRVPVVVRCTRPRALDLAFSLRDDRGRLRDAWPTGPAAPKRDLEPGRKALSEEDWQQDADGYSATFAMQIPVRRPQANDVLSYALVARVPDGIEVAHKFTWERFVQEADPEDGKPRVRITWTAGEAPELARAVPVGPQVHVHTAFMRLESGNSLAVTAPRRFGKSSLIALLEAKLGSEKSAIHVRIDCNAVSAADSGRLDHAEVWKLVGRELGRTLPGAMLGAQLDAQEPALPTAADFEAVRTIAHAQGKKRVVVFFDEAQRLFEAGASYGNRLRKLIATDLAEKAGRASIVFCFVGLTTMTQERLGPDLYPLLNPLSHTELKEGQIAKVIRKVVGTETTIFTTRAARERLARSSWNLYALRTLLMRTQDLVRADYRVWVSVEDVIRAEHEILTELRNGKNPEAINEYIRDSLNAGSSATDFRPVEAFPVAAAYALALDGNRVGKDAVDATRRTLNEWCTTLYRDEIARPRFDDAVITKHLEALVEMRVLDRARDPRGGHRFHSQFLKSYLVGQISSFLYEHPWFRSALLRAGSRTVRLPPESQRVPLGRGAQAHAFRFARDGRELTARVRSLPTPAEQNAFVESVGVLEKIQRIHHGNRQGAEGIFKLIEVGLVDGAAEPEAVEIYDYIPGVDLGSKKEALDAAIVVEIGRALGRALKLVHANDVLHRDIRPENVILQEHASPVLIDFGLARARSAPGLTPLDDPFTAPEVKGATPRWAPAADVFALAKTVDALLSGQARGQDSGRRLGAALQPLMTGNVASRASVSQLLEPLEELASQLGVKALEREFTQRLLEKAAGDVREQELCWIIENGCALQISGFALGMYPGARDRLGAAAFVVNKFAERCEDESVGKWASRTFNRRWPTGIDAIVNLRNEFTHPSVRQPRLYKESDVLDGAREVGRWLGSGELAAVVDSLLSAGEQG